MNLELGGLVHLANGKRRTGHLVGAACAAGQAAHQRGLAAAQVAHQFDDFTALQRLAEPLAELLG
jgi:hypothetical protein